MILCGLFSVRKVGKSVYELNLEIGRGGGDLKDLPTLSTSIPFFSNFNISCCLTLIKSKDPRQGCSKNEMLGTQVSRSSVYRFPLRGENDPPPPPPTLHLQGIGREIVAFSLKKRIFVRGCEAYLFVFLN